MTLCRFSLLSHLNLFAEIRNFIEIELEFALVLGILFSDKLSKDLVKSKDVPL